MVSEGSPSRAVLSDLALELADKSAAFRASLPESIAARAWPVLCAPMNLPTTRT
jgi:hypothetical protein